ncbi:acetyl-CoA hydrolase [Alsobacter metallidurans]|uniref:Acetyl-CoA hydrolase n=1 Tax=Alsobacter metallidurans TaxID=340221 RepID=A0A917I8U8_9HYPH|nr:acetyl-CoA hydrolase/transferase C-terminal domain-containing protein [Alsobacter metallidurans]GGH24359.1 acetyl-CoA hydrolase [Alsobacter metallidurans]
MREAGTPGAARRVNDPAGLVRLLSAGDRIYLPGAGAEVPALVDALCAASAPPLHITGAFVPGINPVPVERLPEGSIWSSPFAQPAPSGSQAGGRLRHLPMSYGAFASHLRGATFDVGFVHVSPPDANGLCSLGIAVEFTPIALQRCRRIFAVVNPRMPRIPGAETFALARADAVLELDTPLREYDVGTPSPQASRIAELIAGFVIDGSTLQVGLGKTPDALMRIVADRRGLRLHSGMLSDATRLLADGGSLDPRALHASCVHVGTAAYYDWLADRADFAVRACDYTHGPATLAGLPRLVAVNSALSVDLFGQANLEMLDGRMISGVGGAADFAQAASLAHDGVSIIALPATSGRNAVSRITARLDGVCSLPRHAIDVVITEHGVADLRGLAVTERAERLVAIAAPEHRGALQDAWKDIAARF